MISDTRRQMHFGLSEGMKRVVIDTDTYIGIDGQFAFVRALLPDEIFMECR